MGKVKITKTTEKKNTLDKKKKKISFNIYYIKEIKKKEKIWRDDENRGRQDGK